MVANLANQGVVLLSQIAVFPLLISSWGVDGFGTWIVLTAIPTYVGLSDFGLSISAKSDMSIRMSRGDEFGARQTLSSVLAIAAGAICVFGSGYIFAIIAFDWTRIFSLHTIEESYAKLMLGFGLVQIVSYQAFVFSAAIIRAMGRPALESSLAAIGRATETLAAVFVAVSGGSLTDAAAAWSLTRAVLSLIIWIVVLVRYPGLRPSIHLVRWGRIKSLLGPSIAYAMMPVAQTVAIQGTTLAVSSFAGPAAVAAFNTTRVISRLGTQLSNTINNTFVPFYSYAIGRNSVVSGLFKEHLVFVLLSLVAYLAFVAVFGESFLAIVSKRQIPFDVHLFSIFVAAASAEMLFSTAIAIQSAANRVGFVAGVYFSLAALVVGLSYFLGSHIGTTGIAALVLAANLVMLALCVLALVDRSYSVVRLGSPQQTVK